MFNLFKKNVKPIENVKEVMVPCSCESGNEHCDLILQLREHQKNKKDIEKTIAELNKDSSELISSFISFLKKLENNGMHMDKYNRCNHDFFIERNFPYIIGTINEYSADNIWRMTEELRTYKKKEEILCDYRRSLKATENAIEEIKSKLGIE